MDTDRLNRWLTLGANAGVLLGLVALVIEINQSNTLALAQMEQARSDGLREWRQEWATNDHIVPMLLRVNSIADLNGDEYQRLSAEEKQASIAEMLGQLNPEDGMRFRFFIFADYWDYENLYAQYRRGLISQEYWEERGISGVLNLAPVWKASGDGELPGGRKAFNDEIERLLKAYPDGLRRSVTTTE